MLEIDKEQGYIVIWRSVLDWDWWEDEKTFKLFVYCCLRAGHKERSYKGLTLKVGSFITSRGKLAEHCNLSEQNVRTCLKNLQSTNDIEVETNKKGTIITVKNYDLMQNTNKMFNQQVTKSQPTPNQDLTTINTLNTLETLEDVVVVDTTDNHDINDNNFLRFWAAYIKHGFKEDSYAYWVSKNYDESTVNEIVHGAVQYSDEMKNDVKHMVYPRTFLKNELWKNYSVSKSESKRQVALDEQQKQLEYLESMGVEIK